MRASDFDFHLPEPQIAQAPAARRDQARLYVLPRAGGESHRAVADLPEILPPRALLVVNDTRVIPARLVGKKPTGGKVELLLVEKLESGAWRCLGGASKPIRKGPLGFAGVNAEVLATDGEFVEVRFDRDPTEVAAVPLPPYIRHLPDDCDRERYQTVFARVPGAVAAPTAGLHFSPELLHALEARGIERAAITLHVGPGTFAPLRSDDLSSQQELHAERYEIPEATALAIANARREGRPVVAVGTTVVRTLESAALTDLTVLAGRGATRLFIKPGHRFAIVDHLITNFHLPRSSLLMLVAAFAGRERILAAYRDAVERGYRFFSYGDAMFIE